MAPVCEGLLAKLNELMDFLQFAKLPVAEFRGVVRAPPPPGPCNASSALESCGGAGDLHVQRLELGR